jgi:hypothetical protein
MIEKLKAALDAVEVIPPGTSLDHLWMYVDESG